jgi:hypothetical protein
MSAMLGPGPLSAQPTRAARVAPLFAALLLAPFAATSARAEPGDPPPAGGAPGAPEAGTEAEELPPETAVDRGHDRIESELVALLDRIDRFFADDNYTAITNESFIRLAPGLRIREGPDFGFRLRVKAALQLPNTQNRIGLVLAGRDEDDDSLDGGFEDDDSFAAGLRAALLDRGRTKLRLAVGSRFRPEPDPFVRLRLQRVQAWERLALRPSVTPFWELDAGVGERTRVDVDYLLGSLSVLRLRGEATYGESTEGVEFRTSITHFFALRERSAWQIRLRMDAHTRPATEVTAYRAEIRYRWSMLRKWLFFEIEPALRLERSSRFDPAPEVTLRVEVIFGSMRKVGLLESRRVQGAMLPQSGSWTSSSSRASGRLPSLLH